MTKGQLIRCYLGIYFWGVSRRWVGCVNDKCIISINYFLDKDSHAQIVMIQFHLPSAEVCSLIPFWSPHLENRKKEIAYPPLNREVTARESKNCFLFKGKWHLEKIKCNKQNLPRHRHFKKQQISESFENPDTPSTPRMKSSLTKSLTKRRLVRKILLSVYSRLLVTERFEQHTYRC